MIPITNYDFEELRKVNVNDHLEQKKVGGGTMLSYLSWPYAIRELKSRFPDMTYTIKRNEQGLPYVYDPNTGYMVFTTMTIGGITNEMWLPVMDNNNHAMKAEPYTIQTKYNSFKVEAATMFDVNKTIMRCLVKNAAMFGLGLYIYAGEDLPDGSEDDTPPPPKEKPKAPTKAQAAPAKPSAVVTKGDKVPPPTPLSDVEKTYRRKECERVKAMLGIDDQGFMQRYNTMRESKAVEDIPMKDLTDIQFRAVIKAFEANFEPA